jgi:hypothetical protein
MAQGEKTVTFVDPAQRPDLLHRLAAAGMDIAGATNQGHLEIRDWDETYLRAGRFDPDAMLALVEAVLAAGQAQGYPRTRLIAEMEWAAGDQQTSDDLIDYEARLHTLLTSYADVVVCTYDLARFGADAIIDVMRTHPIVIIGGILQLNPFFTPPSKFLRERRPRRRGAAPD